MANTISHFISFSPWLSSAMLLLLLPFFSLLLLLRSKKKASNLPPGPPRLPIIGHMHLLGKTPHRSLWKLSKKYGPVMLLQLGRVPTLVVSSSDMAKQILKIHDHECCTRPISEGLRKLSYNYIKLAQSPYNDNFRELRKLLAEEVFSTRKVESSAPLRKQEVAHLLAFIYQSSGRVVNLSDKLMVLSDAMVSRVACGKTYEEVRSGYGKLNDAIHEAMAVLAGFSGADFFPRFGWILDIVTGFHSRREKCFREFDGFYQRILDEHVNDPAKKAPEEKDVVDTLLELSSIKTREGLTKDHIKAILADLFLAGVDTTSITIVWAMTEQVKSPRVMKKVQAEIRSRVDGKKEMVEESDINDMHYLKMVVKETLRLHPPTVMLLPRVATTHIKIGGFDVYPNTRIQVNVWAIGRDPNSWENAEEFVPERFEKDNNVDFKGQHFKFLPFGSGRRICPGITMGITSVECVLANLLYCFDWELPDRMERGDISVEEEGTLTVCTKIPLYLVPVKYVAAPN